MITAANFSAYVKEHGGSSDLFYFVHMVDSAGNNYYFSDYHSQIDSYLPTNLTISAVKYQTNIRDGIYSISPVKVRIDNTAQPTTTGTARFTENFASGEFETEICVVYLGYDGCTSSDFLPYYKGRMVDFSADALGCEFSIADRAIFELPLLPKNKFTRASYLKAPSELIGKPIPLVYGYYDHEFLNSLEWGVRAVVPAYIVEHDLDVTTPQIVLEAADNELSAINDVYIYDENLDSLGKIEDTITNSLSAARATVDLRTQDSSVFITTTHYLYPDRAEATLASGTVENALDLSSETETVVTDGDEITFFFSPDITAIPSEQLLPFADERVAAQDTTVGMSAVQIEYAGYAAASFSGSDSVDISVVNGNFDVSDTTPQTADNATWTAMTGNLDIAYAQRWTDSAAQTSIGIREADDASDTNGYTVTIYPGDGIYATMTEMAQAIEKEIAHQTDDANLANSYSFTYDKNTNKFLLKRIDGTKFFRVFDAASYLAEDLGFTNTTVTPLVDDEDESTGVTVLDVPDGDFSFLKVKFELASGTSQDFNLKGLRIKLTRSYRAWNVAQQSTDGGGRPPTTRGSLSTSATASRTEETRFQRRDFDRRGATLNRPSPPLRYTNKGYRNAQTVLDGLTGSRFYFECIGPIEDESNAYDGGPEIIERLLLDEISIASGDVDATAFDAAQANTDALRFALYLAEQRPPSDIFAELCQLMGGFFAITQDGKYTIKALKSSYSSSDTDFTIHYRDIPNNLRDSIKFYRNPIDDVSTDLDLIHTYNWARGKYEKTTSKALTSDLNIIDREMSTQLINHSSTASTVAEHFSGTGSTAGFFGRQRNMCQITTMDHDLQRAELGDICQFHTDWDLVIDVFGNTPSNVFWMVTGKQYDKSRITFTLTEVYIQGLGPNGEYLPDEAAGDKMLFVDLGRAANEGFTNDGWMVDYPTSLQLGTAGTPSTSAEFATGSSNALIDGGDDGSILSGMDDSGGASLAGRIRYDNNNSDLVHAYTSPGEDAFFVSAWLNGGERVSGTQGSMYLGAPYTTAGSGAKWYFGIDQDNKINFHITDGTTSATLQSTSALSTPFTGQIFAYYDPGNTLVVGSNGVADGSLTPSGSIGSIFGGTTFGNRLHIGGTNVPANYTTGFEGILNRFYIYRIGTSRFPSDAATTIALHNYNKLNGNI